MFDTIAFDQFPSALPSLDHIVSFLRSAFAFVAEAPLPSLIFLAVVFYHVGQHAPTYGGRHAHRSHLAKTIGILTFLGFCLHAYVTISPRGDAVTYYLTLGLRAFLLLVIAEGAATLLLSPIAHIWSILTAPFRLLRRLITRLRRGIAWLGSGVSGAFLWLWTTPPPPYAPPDPSLALKTRVQQAKREFEAACETIRSAGLDEDERESAILFARQKYLRQIHGVMRQ